MYISDIFNLVREAWAVSQENDGVIKAVEGVTVTGGFFDNTADSYVGSVTVWRSIETGNVAGLTFRKIKFYKPNFQPVVNKGFAGGMWYNKKLYVCWPNRVAVIAPALDWAIVRYIDNPQFNDLHHVFVCEGGLWVANTGLDSCLIMKNLKSRTSVDVNVASVNTVDDLRSQKAHTARGDVIRNT